MRYAVYLPEWMPYARIGALFGMLALIGMLWLVARFFRRLGNAGKGAA